MPGKSEWLIVGASAWIALACNLGYWSIILWSNPDGAVLSAGHIASFAVLTLGLLTLVAMLLAWGRATRPVIAGFVILAALAGFFTGHYGTLIDRTMLVNVIETDVHEATELFTLPMVLYVTAFGILPALLIMRTALPKRPFLRAAAERTAGFVLAFALIAVPLTLDQREIFSVVREHRELRHMIAPLDVISATVSHLQDKFDKPPAFLPLGLDAHMASTPEERKPIVHVILLGETARAASFRLTGYMRQTNPELAAESVYNVASVSTCGTATAQSVPCMFSLQTMAEFDGDRTRYQDNLLDIAARAGYEVHWVENGNSCKSVCARVGSEDLTRLAENSTSPLCKDGRCFDEVLVTELQHILRNTTRDTLVVLHQIGSHGPAYYRRYPDAFRRFQPDCRSPDLGDCSSEEIVNAYDNTILYTDHVIAQAIRALDDASDRLQTSLVYVSDHGESLGEHNLYLHGMPRRLAPAEQTTVPMIAWFSDPALDGEGLVARCDNGQVAASHDNLIHTELGILQIETDVYRPGLDLFSGCRRMPQGTGASP